MNRAIYLFFRLMVFINRFIPFFIFYYIADLLYFLLYYLFRYRRKVVTSNLERVFPEKRSKEISELVRKFYRNLSDILLESIKGFSTDINTLVKRFKILNPELLDQYYNEGSDVIILGAHYANWEWGALASGMQTKMHVIGLYKPLSNQYVDEYLKRKRAVWNMELASIYVTTKIFDKDYGKPKAVIMLADQCPNNLKHAVFVDFLGQDTACLHGPEKHGRRKNMPLLYADVQRVKRGHYTLELSELIGNPLELEEGKITEIYMKKLEEIILKQPENWLWSHRRWKRTREKIYEEQ
ncbi:MAG: lysophospholipid acyltransferase family protein [Candidatus Marinimicrobia bacterium]|nr:lysophospholipid acyltransferase family protein [Candidatus Neomarinimicrobiota bacterium]